MTRMTRDHFIGCLLAGAVGDALGWPVEFYSIDEIVERFGPAGIVNMVPGERELFEITDDTQMTLFTSEGLLRAWAAARQSGEVPDFVSAVRHSYLCWLKTQGETPSSPNPEFHINGWLPDIEGLYRQRAPGNTCLSALREGTYSENGVATNNSKGCGGVMRAAPAGLMAARIHEGNLASAARLAFEIGCATAALTHGHPSGIYPAGALAVVVATIIADGSIEEGINTALGFLDEKAGSTETIDAIQSALKLWRGQSVSPSPESIESLGGGWVGEEALAISLYCALVAGEDLAKGIGLAVNHSGDSDSTGAIAGNILGALLGEQAIPHDWLNQLELIDVIRQVGNDLFTAFESSESWLMRYPPDHE